MPSIFEQPNQESEEVTAYNDVEIAGITEYLSSVKKKILVVIYQSMLEMLQMVKTFQCCWLYGLPRIRKS